MGLTTTTHSSILPVPVKCYSSSDTPLHTFSYSYMPVFWRHTAAYFQLQLNDILLATHHCILSVPVTWRSSGDTRLHTFSSSYMLFFWRHTAAYFQFQLNAILLECTSLSLVETVRRNVEHLPQPAFHNFYQTTRCYSPEHNILHRHCHKNLMPHLKGHLVLFDTTFWGK